MAYVDYSYYHGEYFGTIIPEKDFPRIASRASEILDVLTFNRAEVQPNPYEVRIKKACCAIAEVVYAEDMSFNKKLFMGGMDVTSVSSGNESIIFANSTKSNTTDYYNIAKRYLSGTGLLYAGI